MLWKCCTQYVSKFGTLSTGYRTGKVSFHSNPKESKCQRTFKLLHNCTHQPTPVLLPGESHGRRSLVGCMQSMGSLRVGHDWATSLSLFTFMHWRRKWQPLQYSCLENPRDGGAWWSAVYGVTQSRTRPKRLSSSSSSSISVICTVVSNSLRPHGPPGSSVHGILQARILGG